MKNTLLDKSFIVMDGHVLIKDFESGEVLLDKHNAINFENTSVAMAGAIANKTDAVSGEQYHIKSLAYGNAGSTVGVGGAIVYQLPNTNHTDGVLHNQTYEKDVMADPTDDPENSIVMVHTPGQHYTDLIITSTLDYDEPADQQLLDNGGSTEGTYTFDELGIKLKTGKFISHIIFHPIEKSANRKIQIIYTVRIRAGN